VVKWSNSCSLHVTFPSEWLWNSNKLNTTKTQSDEPVANLWISFVTFEWLSFALLKSDTGLVVLLQRRQIDGDLVVQFRDLVAALIDCGDLNYSGAAVLSLIGCSFLVSFTVLCSIFVVVVNVL